MGMREYGVYGYGIGLETLETMIDKNKFMAEYSKTMGNLLEDEIKEAFENENLTTLISEYINEQEGILYCINADCEADSEGYVLVTPVFPWQMWSEDWQLVTSIPAMDEYIYSKLGKIVKDDCKSELIKSIGEIDDTYFG